MTLLARLNYWVPVVLLIALPLAGMLNAWSLHPDHGPNQPAPAMAWFKLELLYRQAADYLAPRLTPSSRLAAGDVGVLGFYTPARILDTVGLNSPQYVGSVPPGSAVLRDQLRHPGRADPGPEAGLRGDP